MATEGGNAARGAQMGNETEGLQSETKTPHAGCERSSRGVSINLPLPPQECHQNRSGRTDGWRTAATVQHAARLAGMIVATQTLEGRVPPRWERCSVTAAFRYPDARRRDLFNMAGAIKNYLDGIGDAGIYRDDSGIVRGELSCEIDRERPGVTISIHPVEGDAK